MSLLQKALLILLLPLQYALSQPPGYDHASLVAINDTAYNLMLDYKFKESLSLAREALKRGIYLKDNEQIAAAYNTIAGNYEELSENDKAIANYRKALAYADRTNNDSIKGWYHNNIGNIYIFEKKDFAAGVAHYGKALEFAEKTRDTSRLVLTRLNLAWAYFDINDYPSGRPHLQFINDHREKYIDDNLEAISLMLNAMDFSNRNQNKEAESYYRKAIESARKNRQELDLSYIFEEYAEFLRKVGRHDEAYLHLQLHHRLSQSIYDNGKLRRAAAEGINFEIDEYKRALDKIESEKEIQDLKLQRSRTVMIVFIIGVAVLLVLLYLLYQNYRYKRNMNLELTAANEELKLARDKAEEASKLKSQFVSTISHELRTPLYGVVGITNMILDEHKELAGSTHLNSLKFSAKYLLALVNDILQINKIEENRLTLENLTFNIGDELNTIKNSLQFIANRNNNSLSAEIDTDIPEFVIGDKLRLSQIFMNLVSNALKFTKNGEVVVSAQLEKVEGNMHYIYFEVRDNGIGIAPADQGKIFEKFVQIERKQDDYQGTGLGLSIVKRLIALFGSEIHLKSTEGVGTTFSFTIAFEVNPDKTLEIINNIEVDLTSAQIFTVLVVEDNKINQMVTRKILENNNLRCHLADDGHAALSMLERNTYDVILMDINMPGMNGFETTRKIRERGITVPIVALTAFEKEEITEEAISSGMNDIIIKPFEPVTLFRILNSQIVRTATSV